LRWCARAPAVRRRLAAAGLQRRGFLPTPGDLQKALEDAQRVLAEAGQKAKEEADKAAKAINENLGGGAEQGKQALEQTQQEVLQKAQEALEKAQQEVLQKAQEALEKAKEEADRAAQVINETLEQAAKGQPGLEAVAGQKVHVVKGLEAAAEQGAQFVNAALAAAGSPQRFGGGGAEAAPEAAPVAASAGRGGRPPEGSSLFWSPDAPDSPAKVGRDTFIATCKTQAADVGALVPEVDVEQYVDYLLASAVLANSALPQALGRQLYVRVVRLTQRGIMAMLSGLEGEVLGKQMRLLWQPSPLNAFHHSSAATVDTQIVKRLAKRALGDKADEELSVPAYLEDLGLDAEKVQELYEDVVALAVRIVMDVGLTKQIRCLGHEVTVNIRPDEALHTAPGWESSLEEGVFGLFGEEQKEKFAKEFVESAMEDPAFHMKGVSEDAQKEMYITVVKVLLGISEVALNHFRIHVGGMAFRPCLTEKEPADTSTGATSAASP